MFLEEETAAPSTDLPEIQTSAQSLSNTVNSLDAIVAQYVRSIQTIDADDRLNPGGDTLKRPTTKGRPRELASNKRPQA